MKRILMCVIAVLSLCGCSEKAEENPAISIEGRFISTKDGNCMMLDESNCPIIMSNETGDADAFKDLDTGDIIRIECESVMESYPARTQILKLEFVCDGELSDLPTDVVERLEQMGWEISE